MNIVKAGEALYLCGFGVWRWGKGELGPLCSSNRAEAIRFPCRDSAEETAKACARFDADHQLGKPSDEVKRRIAAGWTVEEVTS